MIIDPDKAIVMGGSWRVPVLVGLLSKSFVNELKEDGTFNEAAFDREYESRWTGSVEDAFFNGEQFDRSRKLVQPEYGHSGRSNPGAYYVLGMDVGRRGCTSELCVIKVTPQSSGNSIKSLVNAFQIADEHFEDQAKFVKQKYYDYKARAIVIDANGIGMGLVDYMVKAQVDPLTGEVTPPFGVENDPDGFYKKFITPETEQNAMYLLKANAPLNTEAHSNVQAQLRSGKLRFLVDERVARNKLLSTKKGQAMRPDERQKYLTPFTYTSILRDQMLNLREENEGVNINLKQVTKKIAKDRFSAFEYALYYIKQEEDARRRRKKRSFAKFMFMS